MKMFENIQNINICTFSRFSTHPKNNEETNLRTVRTVILLTEMFNKMHVWLKVSMALGKLQRKNPLGD